MLLSYCRLSRNSLNLLISTFRLLGTRADTRRVMPLALKKVDASKVSNFSDFVQRLTVPHRQMHTICKINASRLKSTSFYRYCIYSAPDRWFSVSSQAMGKLSSQEVRRRVEDLSERFAEARELLGDARESLGSTYFSEDMSEAQEAVSTTTTSYEALLAELDEDQRSDVVRTIGLRMEELKAQEQAIKDLLD